MERYRYFLCQQSIDEGGAEEGVRIKVVLCQQSMERQFLCQQSIDEGGAAEGVRPKVVFMPAVHGKVLFMPAVH